MFKLIRTSTDIKEFLDVSNALHDGYIIGVEYVNEGINGRYFNQEQTKLTIKILVTSIYNTVVEMKFKGISSWQITDYHQGFTNTSIVFDKNNQIVWLDDIFINLDEVKNNSYVIAEAMEWRIIK